MEQIRAGQARISEFLHKLKYRLDYHDQSALREDELAAPDMSLHYSRNTHHPEHFGMGVGAWGMTLLDLIEMLAAEKAEKGDAFDVQALCRKHGIYSQLAMVLQNSAREMGWQS